MDADLRRMHLLYAVGVLLGLVTAFYFAFVLLEDLSPTITAILLFLGFAFFGLAGLATDGDRLDVVAYLLSAGMYLIGVWYTIARFEIGDVGVFGLLAASSGLFIALGYLSNAGYLAADRRAAMVGMVAILALGAVLLGADVVGPQPTTEATFEESIDVPDRGEQVAVGTVTVRNEFFLSRAVDPPEIHGCLYVPEREVVPIRATDWPPDMLLSGGESSTTQLVIRGVAFYDPEADELREPFAERDAVPVETADECPSTADPGTLVVVEGPPPQPGRP